MTADLLKSLIAMNLAAGGAILLLLLLGPTLRRTFGARLAYAAWAVVPLAALAALLPARAVDALPIGPAPVRPLAEGAVQVLIMGPSPAVDWTQVAVGAWALGALLLIALTVWTQARTLGLIGRLTREGGIVRSANPAIGPAILGIFRPRIMLPSDFEDRFDETERAVIMAHEESHIASGDARINAVVELIRCLFWFNPLIHLAARRLRIDQELACDAVVIARFPKARRTYAEALLKTQVSTAPLPLGCYWPERSTGRLKERLTMLTLKTPGRARSLTGAACLAILGLGTGYAAWAAAPAAPEAAEVLDPIAALAEPFEIGLSAPEPQEAAPTLTNSRAAPPVQVEPAPPPEDRRDRMIVIATPVDGTEPSGPPGAVFRREILRMPMPEGPELDAIIAQLNERRMTGQSAFVACRDEGEGMKCYVDGTEKLTPLPDLPPPPPGVTVRTFQMRRLATPPPPAE